MRVAHSNEEIEQLDGEVEHGQTELKIVVQLVDEKQPVASRVCAEAMPTQAASLQIVLHRNAIPLLKPLSLGREWRWKLT